ncbi:hypothetical protein GM3708_272 [Geminocystis sp. NIES-3708]|uniref:DUF2092 domain-containing protein n=1 Tax=Geminocystis sp. NIES-3708 TaxID=1615909 RepID=UPI0005FCD268|nr:DUF2092 domain-containing protein [Geminocystis sp. NIES-3708]BAQ59866.1 hypothetical protein GM3708_272 [Geminocystis sp. NIES-3708]
MINPHIFFVLIISLITTFTLSEKVEAQNQDDTTSSSQTSSITTDKLLTQVCDFLKSKSSFTVTMDITYDNVLESGSKVQYSGYQKVEVQKPNFLHTDYVGDQGNKHFYYDGKNFTLFSPDLKVFATKKAPATLDELVNNIEEKHGFTIPMSNLLVNNPCNVLESATEDPLYIGSDLVNRVENDHILIVTEDWDGQLWISQTEPPLISKILLTYKKLPNSPQYTVLFSDWNFESSIPKETFIFKPMKDDVQIQMLPPFP